MSTEGKAATAASAASMSEHVHIEAALWWTRLAAAPLDSELAARFEHWMAQSDLHRLAYADIASVSYALEQLPIQEPRFARSPDRRKPVHLPSPSPALPGHRGGSKATAGSWQTSAPDAAWTSAPATQLAPRIAASRKPWRGLLRATQTMAAVLLLCVAWLNLPTWLENARADHHTGVAQQRQIELEDGSVLNLDSDSAVALHFEGRRREVELLRGTAHVQVKPDPARAFVLRAGTRQALALGTAYSLEYESGKVIVDHGRVQVSDGTSTQEVSAGQIAEPQAVEWLVRNDPTALGPPDWMRGQRIFVQRPLREVLVNMDRYLYGRMWLRESAALDQPITAILDLSDPSLALAQLCAAHGLQMQTWPGLIVIGTP